MLFMVAACGEDKSPPAEPKGLNAVIENNAVKLSWDRVRGVDAYRVETSVDGVNFTTHPNTTDLFFMHEDAIIGVNHYRVRSIRFGSKDEYFSRWAVTSFNFARPGGGDEPGLYLGIIGFNSNIITREISFLTKTNRGDFQNWINGLEMGQFTGLYYAVDNAITILQGALLPEDLGSVSIVTFTDGLDNVSIMLNTNYTSPIDYRNALRNRISNTRIKNLPINAYSIGIRGNDVTDVAGFRAGLEAIASHQNNVHEVTNMIDVENRFRDIANSLHNVYQRHILKLKIPGGYADNTRIRFTFDDVTEAVASNMYIEGVLRRNGANVSLQNVVYHGLTSSNSATTITGTVETVSVTFSFENITTAPGIIVSTSNLQQWYMPPSSPWQVNGEFEQSSDIQIDEVSSSAVIMLVLDCTTSLGSSGFSDMKRAATDFIQILTR